MATTNRQFDNKEALTVIERKAGMKVPHDIGNVQVEVLYGPPVGNTLDHALVRVTVEFAVSIETADEILGV